MVGYFILHWFQLLPPLLLPLVSSSFSEHAFRKSNYDETSTLGEIGSSRVTCLWRYKMPGVLTIPWLSAQPQLSNCEKRPWGDCRTFRARLRHQLCLALIILHIMGVSTSPFCWQWDREIRMAIVTPSGENETLFLHNISLPSPADTQDFEENWAPRL